MQIGFLLIITTEKKKLQHLPQWVKENYSLLVLPPSEVNYPFFCLGGIEIQVVIYTPI